MGTSSSLFANTLCVTRTSRRAGRTLHCFRGTFNYFGTPPRLWQRPQQLWRCVIKFSLSHWLLIYRPEATLCGSLRWDWPFAIFQICAASSSLGSIVFPSCMLDLISFAVEVVGLDYVIEAVSRPPSLPALPAAPLHLLCHIRRSLSLTNCVINSLLPLPSMVLQPSSSLSYSWWMSST